MGHFVFIDYTGEDSGSVLAKILNGESDEPHEVVAQTQRVVGFTLNEPDEDEDEGEDDEPDTD